MHPHFNDSKPGLSIRCSMVSVIVLRGTGDSTRMLVVRRSGDYLDGLWSYVAGHIAAGEAGWQAALRELQEETRLVPDTLHATSFCEQFYASADDCIEVVPAFVARVSIDATVHLNQEHSEFRWVSMDDAADLLPFGSQRDLLAHIRREFIEREPSAFLQIDLP